MSKIIVDKKDSVKYRFELGFTKRAENECWIWEKGKNRKGYGIFSNKLVSRISHRASYEIYIGKIPKGLLVCHSCDNPSCINPKHLWLGTISENNADRDKKGRFIKIIGEQHGKAVLNTELVKSIKIRIKSGEPMAKIARELNLKYGTVANLKFGSCWTHIEI